MVWRVFWPVLVAAPFFAVSVVAQTNPVPRDTGESLPEGAGKEIVVGACLECHSSERMTSVYRSPAQWKEIVERMVAGGAPLKDSEKSVVAQYLARNYGLENAQALLKNASAPPALPRSPLKPVANVFQLMKSIVIPNADVVWRVAQDVPKDDEEWSAVQNSALTLAEAGNMLMIGSRAKDQGNWVKGAQALVDTGTAAFRAAQARDAGAVSEAGDKMYSVCAGCHRQYKRVSR